MPFSKRFFSYAIVILSILPLAAQSSSDLPLSLDQCIAISLRFNPQLLSSQLTVAENDARVQEVRSGFLPSLNLNAAASRMNAKASDPINSYSTALMAQYTLFRGGKTAAATKAAHHVLDASKVQHEINEQEFILRVTQAYYGLVQAERLIHVAEKSLERARLYLDYANARLEAGVAPRSDILKARVELSNAELNKIRAFNVRRSAQGWLNSLLGRTAGSTIEILDDLESAMKEEVLPYDAFLSLAYQHRPELKRFDFLLLAQESNIRMARGDYYPTVSLDAKYGLNGGDLAGTNPAWSAGLSLNLPVFNGFSTSARVTQEELAHDNLKKQEEALQQQISLEVWDGHSALVEAQERVQSTLTFVANAQENLLIAEGQYREGVGTMLEVTDAQTDLLTAEQSHIEALVDQKIAVASLARAVGNREIKEK
jgi:outer membrane protein TolC